MREMTTFYPSKNRHALYEVHSVEEFLETSRSNIAKEIIRTAIEEQTSSVIVRIVREKYGDLIIAIHELNATDFIDRNWVKNPILNGADVKWYFNNCYRARVDLNPQFVFAEGDDDERV